MRQLFLSCGPSDLPFAEDLRHALLEQKVRGILPKLDLAPGEPYWAGTRAAIEASDALVLIVSEVSLLNKQLLFEAGMARMRHVPMLAVAAPDTARTENVAAFLEAAAPAELRFDADGRSPDELARLLVQAAAPSSSRASGWWRRLFPRRRD